MKNRKRKKKQETAHSLNLPEIMYVPIRPVIPLRIPRNMTIRELARVAFMLGLEIDFNVKDIKKGAKNARRRKQAR